MRASGVDVRSCTNCRKCTQVCPTAAHMDMAPAALVAAVTEGDRERALGSKGMWLCVSCGACTRVCPEGIDVEKVFGALCALSAAVGAPKQGDVRAFHEAFLARVRRRGRIHETCLAAAFKAKEGRLLSGLDMAAALFLRGKLPVLPRRVKDAAAVEAIFRAAGRGGGGGA